MREMPDILNTYESIWLQAKKNGNLTWHDDFQYRLIETYLSSMESFEHLVEFLDISTEHYPENLDFAANYLIILRAQGRIDYTSIKNYNRVITRYINQIGHTEDSTAFYVAFGVLGEKQQIASYTDYLLSIEDDSRKKKLIDINEKLFQNEMLERIYDCLVTYSIYKDYNRNHYFSSMSQDHFSPSPALEDQENIEIFKWVFEQKGPNIFTRALGAFTELARKFMIEGKEEKAL